MSKDDADASASAPGAEQSGAGRRDAPQPPRSGSARPASRSVTAGATGNADPGQVPGGGDAPPRKRSRRRRRRGQASGAPKVEGRAQTGDGAEHARAQALQAKSTPFARTQEAIRRAAQGLPARAERAPTEPGGTGKRRRRRRSNKPVSAAAETAPVASSESAAVRPESLAPTAMAEPPSDNERRPRERRRSRRPGRRDEVDDQQAARGSLAAAPSSGGPDDAPQNGAARTNGARRPHRNAKRRDAPRAHQAAPPDPRIVATAEDDLSLVGASEAVLVARPSKPVRPRRHRGGTSSSLYAALDLGTNNCRLLVATPRPRGDFRVVDAFSRIVRLGEGLGASGRLSDEAMDRAVEALAVCASKLGHRAVRRFRLIATEACRRAANGEAFLRRVRRETGLELEIVDRRTEARLAVSGCGVLVDRKAKGAVLFDIGGGSSELSLLDLTRRRRRPSDAIVAWTSLPLGVVTLSEKHGGGRRVTRHVFETMVEEVGDHLARFEGRHALADASRSGDIHLLGTSGTVTTLAGVHLQLPRYDRRYVDGVWMRSADVDRTIDDLLDMGFDRRVANPCIGRDRADLVLAGCAILVAIQRMWPCERLRVADRGLREGILSELMYEDGAWHAHGHGHGHGQGHGQGGRRH